MDISNISIGQKGTIFIVDISGYTKFVKETEHTIGMIVVSQLLAEIISANELSFEISEVEGDAILFYRYGKAFPAAVILDQFEKMLGAFREKVSEMLTCAVNLPSLSIKAVAHYGEIGQFKVGRFTKLYGKVVIEAHRLLKNEVHQHTYSLITEQYLESSLDTGNVITDGFQLCERYDIGELCYTYFPYSENMDQQLLAEC